MHARFRHKTFWESLPEVPYDVGGLLAMEAFTRIDIVQRWSEVVAEWHRGIS